MEETLFTSLGRKQKKMFPRIFSPLLPGTGEGGNDSFFCRFLSAHAKRKEFFRKRKNFGKNSSDFFRFFGMTGNHMFL